MAVALGWFSAFGPALVAADLVPIPALGLRVARGFRVTLWADAHLANDISAMTLDAQGEVVVTGPGYIRTLSDANGDGVADTATEFAPLTAGGTGLCGHDDDLYCLADGALWRYSDRNQDGVADGEPDRLLLLETSEHGGHAIRPGPDGWLHLMAGNQARFPGSQAEAGRSPVRQIEGGALLRLTPDGQGVEAIAHGFFNPQDFDFNWVGDVFACDSDVEADLFLPWHVPDRLYHVAYGGHHGCRSESRQRNRARPDYYVDTAERLTELDRGWLTGVLCYRHTQFPPVFRNGLFLLDWVLGKVYFVPLTPDGDSYLAAPEVFLESIGAHGFTPSDIVVTPGGSLLISTGGHRTRGAIYRVDFLGAVPPLPVWTNWLFATAMEVDGVLNAPQPLEAWSRAAWLPVAQQLGPEPFAQAVADQRLMPSERVRAVEVLTEVHGGLIPPVAAAGAQANSPFVRARVAWALGRIPSENAAPLLLGLARDLASRVRVCALDALADHAGELDNPTLQLALAANLTHPDQRVRQAATRLATYLSEPAWQALWTQRAQGDPQSRLSIALALLWRSPQASINTPAAEVALSALRQSKIPEHRLQAIRLLILALGDYRLREPSLEVYAPYEVAGNLQGHEGLAAKIRQAVHTAFPSGDPGVDFEAARLLAMLADDAPDTPAKVLGLITDKSSAVADFHYLTVLARLKGPNPQRATEKVARALLALDRKLAGQEVRGVQNWTVRLAEVVAGLVERDPSLADALVRHAHFAVPAHVMLVPLLGPERYLAAARRFLEAVRRDPKFVWSGPLVDLLSALPTEEVRPVFRQQWANVALRDELLLKLAQNPEALDRDKFIAGLDSRQAEVARACMTALLKLPRNEPGKVVAPTLRRLRRLLEDPKEQADRAQLLALLNRETGQNFRVRELASSPEQLKLAYQPVFDWCAQKYAGLNRQLESDSQTDPAGWNLKLKAVNWGRGDPLRGEGLFYDRGCADCHAGAQALGPDLGGVANQRAPVDLFTAIVLPSREVAAPYRPTLCRTRDGSTHSGLVVFESRDVVLLQTPARTTVRLYQADIVSRQPSPVSFMPAGLLNGWKPQEMADLYLYLQALPRKNPGGNILRQ